MTEAEAAAYAGDSACISCHPAISKTHVLSRHARTLKAVTNAEHGDYFRTRATVADTLMRYNYTVDVKNEQCVIAGRQGEKQGVLSADYVFGSGRNAHTYMSRVNNNKWIDLRLSYYTGARKWDFTPMQKPGDRVMERAAGIEQVGERLVNCIACHATVIRAASDGVDAVRSHLGIGCERCHGPGRSHAESARAVERSKREDHLQIVRMEDLKHATPLRINDICGACHRTPENAPAGNEKTENGLARFEGAALPRSACFRVSGTLSCVTCHDPHGDADASETHNDAKCLSCHRPGSSPKRPSNSPSDAMADHNADTPHQATTLCRINQKSGCVRCHMPAQIIKTIPYATYHNHWIKVWRAGDRANQ